MVNIATLLKDCPKGTELWCTLYGKVKFISVNFDKTYPIQIALDNTTVEKLDKYGRYYDHFAEAECILFPSKEVHTWEGWKLPVKPNFNVGDWIIGNEGIFKITQYEDEHGYDLTDTTGCVVHFVSPDYVESNFHLWTIQDAKDGDVFALNGKPFIYSSHKYGKNYCYIDEWGQLRVNFSLVFEGNYVCPATKQERDLLFSKMREVGYEWDADKKELHKIKSHYDIANFHAGMPVLVRETSLNAWQYVLFSHCYIGGDGLTRFNAGLVGFTQCIPYNDDTKHLLGTTGPCEECYINW